MQGLHCKERVESKDSPLDISLSQRNLRRLILDLKEIYGGRKALAQELSKLLQETISESAIRKWELLETKPTYYYVLALFILSGKKHNIMELLSEKFMDRDRTDEYVSFSLKEREAFRFYLICCAEKVKWENDGVSNFRRAWIEVGKCNSLLINSLWYPEANEDRDLHIALFYDLLPYSFKIESICWNETVRDRRISLAKERYPTPRELIAAIRSLVAAAPNDRPQTTEG